MKPSDRREFLLSLRVALAGLSLSGLAPGAEVADGDAKGECVSSFSDPRNLVWSTFRSQGRLAPIGSDTRLFPPCGILIDDEQSIDFVQGNPGIFFPFKLEHLKA